MKKQKLKKRPKAPEDMGHLDETLTKATTSTAKGLKKHRKFILIVLIAAAGVILVAYGIGELRQSRLEDFHRRFFEALEDPVSRDEEPNYEALDALLAEVQGEPPEHHFLRATVGYYLEHADELAREEREKQKEEEKDGTDTEPDETPPDDPGGTPQPEGRLSVKEARDRALELARDAAKRYPDDTGVQAWAAAVEEKVDGERKEGWLPPPREYRLKLPVETADPEAKEGAAEESSTNANAGDSAPEGEKTAKPPEE